MPEPTVAVARALLSVSDKTGLIPFATRLAALGIELVSTGGTAQTLAKAGLPVTDVSTLTGWPEMLDGRVKTLHPAVHAGLLADLNRGHHREALSGAQLRPIGLLVCNLYPFEDALADGTKDAKAMVETIDVGGPTMVRAAAKNHENVAVVVDAEDYDTVADALEARGTTFALRRRLAAKAFARLSAYDATVARWMAHQTGPDDLPVDHTVWHSLGGKRVLAMRYGENPHQSASFYRSGAGGGLADAELLQGKALSYNNVADADAAWGAVQDFKAKPSVVIVKHANPCGIARGATLAEAYEAARRCDPVSAFGGVVALSAALDGEAAGRIAQIFTEVVIAPAITDEARDILAAKPNLRVLIAPPSEPAPLIRTVAGGFLVQDADTADLADVGITVPTTRAPTNEEMADLAFAWAAVKHVKSNAIVYAKGGATVGIGAGQMSRVDAARIGAWKAEDAAREAGEPTPRTKGAVAASDAFFPFADGLDLIAASGVTAVIQPGGSRRDPEVIAAANTHNIAMVFTGIRHFRH